MTLLVVSRWKNPIALLQIVAAGVFVAMLTQHGSTRWVLGGILYLLLFVVVVHEFLAVRSIRSGFKAELATVSDDELLTRWRDLNDVGQIGPAVARRSLARQRRAVERELGSRGVALPEQN
jgi:membrane protein YdbS with pleckstrin-like domain